MKPTISMDQAKQLATKLEMELVTASFPPAIEALSPARLKQKVDRARKLETKYRDLAREQSRGAKPAGRRGSPERTVQKQTLFAETRARFEARLAS